MAFKSGFGLSCRWRKADGWADAQLIEYRLKPSQQVVISDDVNDILRIAAQHFKLTSLRLG